MQEKQVFLQILDRGWMREGKHAAKGGTMKVLIVLEGLLFTEDGGIFRCVDEHIHPIWCLLDGQRSKGRGHWHCCASGGEKMSFPLSSLMWVISHYYLPLPASCLDCYWLFKSLSLSSLNVFPQIKFMEGMSLKETSDKKWETMHGGVLTWHCSQHQGQISRRIRSLIQYWVAWDTI